MSDRYLRRREVETETAQSRATIYRKIRDGDFPRPVRIGPGSVRWRESDVRAWKANHQVTSPDT